MKQYLDACREILEKGVEKPNRTGTNAIGMHGIKIDFPFSV